MSTSQPGKWAVVRSPSGQLPVYRDIRNHNSRFKSLCARWPVVSVHLCALPRDGRTLNPRGIVQRAMRALWVLSVSIVCVEREYVYTHLRML